MTATLLLLLPTALAATPTMNSYLPGAEPLERGTGYVGAGPLFLNTQDTSRYGLHLQAGYDLGQTTSLSTTMGTASADGDLWAMQDIALRWQPINERFLAVATYGGVGTMSDSNLTELWPMLGLAVEGGLDMLRLDFSSVLPVFLFDGLESIPNLIIGSLALLEFGASLRWAQRHRLRLGKSAMAMVLGYQLLHDTWYIDVNVGYTPFEPWVHSYLHGGVRF